LIIESFALKDIGDLPMALSVVDVYQKVLPKTNCKDCGFATCLSFASMVVSEKLSLSQCPHLDPDTMARYQAELDQQHADGKWVKKDMAKEALQWAKERSASMQIEDLPARIGGKLVETEAGPILELPYFSTTVFITPGQIVTPDGVEVNRWEQVFMYNHMAQGGSALAGENWKGLEQIPNTVSKIKSMREHVEAPLINHFKGRSDALLDAARTLGGVDIRDQHPTADVAVRFQPLPRVPVLLLFWDASAEDGFDAQVKLLFDETITEHLDIESIMFLSERIKQLLNGEEDSP
jgi:hypothetical protein